MMTPLFPVIGLNYLVFRHFARINDQLRQWNQDRQKKAHVQERLESAYAHAAACVEVLLSVFFE